MAACGRYTDFSLPPMQAGEPIALRFEQQLRPVLVRGAPGEWDSGDVLNPAVALRDGLYYNFYSGFDGKTWHTGLATSADGVDWQKQGRVLSPDPQSWEGNYIAANGAVLAAGGQFLYWFQAGERGSPRIGLARSADGRRWTKVNQPVLGFGPRGSWDERGLADPFVMRLGDFFYMYYLGQDRARRQRLGVSRSRDGVHWEKLRSNPVLELGDDGEFDEEGLGEPAVWASHGWYWMLYTGRNRTEHRRLGLARSPDGVHWQKVSLPLSGRQNWDSRVMCDPAVEVRPGSIRVWFGGGDVASPDENLHGQIGLGIVYR